MPTIVVYLPSSPAGVSSSYTAMVWMLIQHWLQQDEEQRLVVVNATGNLPVRLHSESRISAVKARPSLPGAAGRLMRRRQLEQLCRQHAAICWAPMGMPFALAGVARQVIGLPWPVGAVPQEWVKAMAQTNWPSGTCFTVSVEQQQQYWRQQGLQGIVPVLIGEAIQYQAAELSWARGEAIKTRHAGGYEYWLYYGPMEPEADIIFVLKAFSQFKKRHHTNMALVLMGYGAAPAGLVEKLKTYAYRQSVHLAELLNAAERQQVLAACYGVIRGPQQEDYSRPLLEALSQGTLCLVANGMDHGLAGEAAIAYTDTESLFKAMSHGFTDEMMRNRMKQNSAEQAIQFAPAALLERLLPCFIK